MYSDNQVLLCHFCVPTRVVRTHVSYVVEIGVHACLPFQDGYTCVNISLRRCLCALACYLGGLETNWLSPLRASHGWSVHLLQGSSI